MMLLTQTLVCTISLIQIGQELIVSTTTPHGNCSSRDYCCPLNKTTDIRFLLFTRDHPTGPGIVLDPDSSPDTLANTLLSAGGSSAFPTIIFVHGFLEQMPGPSGNTVRDAYLERGNYNIILVDWAILSAAPWYATSVQNTAIVGKRVAKFLKVLDANGLLPMDGVQLVGFSLGAQIVGIAGKTLKATDGKPRVKRITGLDPAYPLYRFVDKSHRLQKSDAEFVDVIHTDAGIFGYPTQLGHVDFYPNGGRSYQPGCSPQAVFVSQRRLIDGFISCSHQLSWKIYADTVRNPRSFPASRCSRWSGFLVPCKFKAENYMGFAASPYARGKFYLRTNMSPPFGRGLQQ